MAKEQTKKSKGVASKHYQVSGNKIERKNKSCPKCGPGVLMAKHANRLYCGNCHYVEMLKQ